MCQYDLDVLARARPYEISLSLNHFHFTGNGTNIGSPRSQPGARRREERGRPSGPDLHYSSLSLRIALDIQQLQLQLKCEMQFPTTAILNYYS